MYWIDSGNDTVKRATLAGASVTTLISGLTTPRGIRLDLAARKLYLIDSGTDKIQRANLDGTGLEDVVTSGMTTPEALDLLIPVRVTTHAYDAINRRTSSTDPYGSVATTVYDNVGNATTRVNERGFATYYTYDALNRQTHVKDPVHFASTYLGYDAVGNAVLQADQQGQSTYLTYDRVNRSIFTVDPATLRTYLAYDEVGARTFQRLVLGPGGEERLSYMRHDAVGRVNRQIAADGGASYFAFDAAGNRTLQLDPMGRPAYTTYDLLNRQETRKDAAAAAWTSVFDARSSVTHQIDPLGRTAYMAYDALGRLSTQSNALGDRSYFQFDPRGNQVRVQNPRGYSTYFRMDLRDRTSLRINALAGVTYMGYDSVGNRVLVRDELFQPTYMTYDGLDRLSTTKDALLGVTYLGYDERSSLVKRIDGDGRTAYLVYDAAKRLDRQYFLTGVSGETSDAPNYFVYDAVGNVKIADDRLAGLNVTYHDYDKLDRPTKRVTIAGAVYYAYDLSGLKTSLKDPDLQENVYVYDTVGRLEREQLEAGKTVYFAWDASGLLTRRHMPQNIYIAYMVYDVAGRMSSLNQVRQSPPDQSRSYVRNANGAITREDDPAGSMYYEYDALDRLTRELLETSFGPQKDTQYVYDAASNRSIRAANLDFPATRTYYTYDVRNLLTREHILSGATTYYDFDAAQRMTRQRSATAATYFAFTQRDQVARLVNVAASPDPVHYFSYSGIGERVRVREGANEAYWAYDGDKLLREQSPTTLVARYRHNTSPPPSVGSNVLTYFYFTPDGGPNRGWMTVSPRYDERGSITQLSKTAGGESAIETYSYDRFGVTTAGNNDYVKQRLRFVIGAPFVALSSNSQGACLMRHNLWLPISGILCVRRSGLAVTLGSNLPGGGLLLQEGQEGGAPEETEAGTGPLPQGFPDFPGRDAFVAPPPGKVPGKKIDIPTDCPAQEGLTFAVTMNPSPPAGDWEFGQRPKLELQASFPTAGEAKNMHWIQYVRGSAEFGTHATNAYRRPQFDTVRIPRRTNGQPDRISDWTVDLTATRGMDAGSFYPGQKTDGEKVRMWDAPGLGVQLKPPLFWTARFYFASYIACASGITGRNAAIAYGVCVWSIEQDFNMDKRRPTRANRGSTPSCRKIDPVVIESVLRPTETTNHAFEPIDTALMAQLGADQVNAIRRSQRERAGDPRK